MRGQVTQLRILPGSVLRVHGYTDQIGADLPPPSGGPRIVIDGSNVILADDDSVVTMVDGQWP